MRPQTADAPAQLGQRTSGGTEGSAETPRHQWPARARRDCGSRIFDARNRSGNPVRTTQVPARIEREYVQMAGRRHARSRILLLRRTARRRTRILPHSHGKSLSARPRAETEHLPRTSEAEGGVKSLRILVA